jgi:hypothetical protein
LPEHLQAALAAFLSVENGLSVSIKFILRSGDKQDSQTSLLGVAGADIIQSFAS